MKKYKEENKMKKVESEESKKTNDDGKENKEIERKYARKEDRNEEG